jgi:hypothetical protein
MKTEAQDRACRERSAAPHSRLKSVAKTDYVVLRERAREIVAELRRAGKWDARAAG